MTPEELQEALATLTKQNEELATAKGISDKKAEDLATDLENVAAAKLESDKKVAELQAEKKESAPVQFEVAKGGESGKGHSYDAGTYEFTCPKFTHQKGADFIEVDVREMDKSDDPKVKQLFDEIKAELVMSNSGIVRLVEPKD